VRVEGAASCTRSEKVVHAKTVAAPNTANALTMTVTRRFAEGPGGGAAGGLSTLTTFTTIATGIADQRFPCPGTALSRSANIVAFVRSFFITQPEGQPSLPYSFAEWERNRRFGAELDRISRHGNEPTD
jgi:hypothetical protein